MYMLSSGVKRVSACVTVYCVCGKGTDCIGEPSVRK